MSSGATVLELAGVSKVYPGAPPIHALDHVDLAVTEGELAVIVGPSGSGKSTLINLVGALQRPTSGRVQIDGHDVTRMRDPRVAAVRGRRIGFVFQQFHLLNRLTALDNVANGLLYAGVPKRRRTLLPSDALDADGLADRGTLRPGELTGVDCQRDGSADDLNRVAGSQTACAESFNRGLVTCGDRAVRARVEIVVMKLPNSFRVVE